MSVDFTLLPRQTPKADQAKSLYFTYNKTLTQILKFNYLMGMTPAKSTTTVVKYKTPMKKITLIAGLISLCGLAQATTISAPSSLVGTSVLNGNNAYAWNITTVVVPTGQTVDSATLTFNNINLTRANSSGQGYLYTDLLSLRSSSSSVSSYTDYDAAGDYFGTKSYFRASLGTQFFSAVGTILSWSYTFTGAQLVSLNTLLAGGGFSIGFDPDCTYSVGGLSFSYTTASTTTPHGNVPDAATTALLLGASLLGLEVLRRNKFAPAVKA